MEHLTVEQCNIRRSKNTTFDGGALEHLMVEQWNSEGGTVVHQIVEQWNSDGGIVEHRKVEQ